MSTYNLKGVLSKKEQQAIMKQFGIKFKTFETWAIELNSKRPLNPKLTEKIRSFIGEAKYDFLYKLEYIISKPLILDYLFNKMFDHYIGTLDYIFHEKCLEHGIMPSLDMGDNSYYTIIKEEAETED